MANVVFVRNLSETFGMDERIIWLLFTLFLSYPLAFIYRTCIFRCSPNVHHLFFAITGMAMYYMNFGSTCLFAGLNILVVYLILLVAAGSLSSVITAFMFNTVYLVLAYWYMKNNVVDTYEITWTIPQCVLTLRLTAVVWDMYDSLRPQSELSNEQRACVLPCRPSLLQMFGHSNVLSTFLIGPQFSMKRYQDLTTGKFCDRTTGGPPLNVAAGITRLGVGLACAAIYQVLTPFFPQSYFNGPFLTDSFLYQCFFLAMWAKVVLYRYIACWVIAEGSLILLGLTYNGQDNNGNDMWDGCANVNLYEYETTTTFRGIIDSFNVNTNKWMSQYIFKRLKFVGMKSVSTGATLVYLALWHGLHSGYYHTFCIEFFTMAIENTYTPIIARMSFIRWLTSYAIIRKPLELLHLLLLRILIAYCLLGFCLLKFTFYFPVYKAMYLWFHIVTAVLWVGSMFIPTARAPRTPRTPQAPKRD